MGGKDSELSGLLRISSDARTSVLKSSGAHGIFLKPLASDPQHFVTWQPRLDQENACQYRQRIPKLLLTQNMAVILDWSVDGGEATP